MGCGACEPVCPVDCIKIGTLPANGQLAPIVDQEACAPRCDVCLRICPAAEVDFVKLGEKYLGGKSDRPDLGINRRSVVVHATDQELRYRASSGGAATALLLYLLRENFIDGAVVVRMNQTKPDEAEVIVARTAREILESRGSKYCPAGSALGLKTIMEQPGRYAFVGLSCHVHAARKFQEVYRKYKDRIAVTFGIFCGGGITHLGTEFMLRQIGVKPGELVKLTIRGDGWPGQTTALRRDGSQAELKKLASSRTIGEKAVYLSWMHRYFFPERCLTCSDVTAQLADISFGDPWLERFIKTDKVGLSMVVCRSALGQRFLDLAVRDGELAIVDDVTPDEVVMSQGKLPKKTHLKPYRIAARWLGIQVPDYHGQYEGGSGGLFAVAVATWEYMRLRLARHRSLWPVLVWYESLQLKRQLFIAKWRGRFHRKTMVLRKIMNLAPTPSKSDSIKSMD